MKLKLVSFELAKKLKEIGFDWECDSIHHFPDGGIGYNVGFLNWNDRGDWASAPTLELTKMWFREKHNLYIKIDYDFITYDVFIYNLKNEVKLISYLSDNSEYCFLKYEEALENGLLKACELIKNK